MPRLKTIEQNASAAADRLKNSNKNYKFWPTCVNSSFLWPKNTSVYFELVKHCSNSNKRKSYSYSQTLFIDCHTLPEQIERRNPRMLSSSTCELSWSFRSLLVHISLYLRPRLSLTDGIYRSFTQEASFARDLLHFVFYHIGALRRRNPARRFRHTPGRGRPYQRVRPWPHSPSLRVPTHHPLAGASVRWPRLRPRHLQHLLKSRLVERVTAHRSVHLHPGRDSR